MSSRNTDVSASAYGSSLLHARRRAAARVRANIALRIGAFALVNLVAFGVAGARKRDAVPASGLPAIRLFAAAPDFAYDAGAGQARLSLLAGHVVVLNFWATWCEPCRAELDALARLRAEFGTSVALLTISAEAPGVARAFLRERQLDLPVIEDPASKIFSTYTIEPIPVTLVLGDDGTVRHVSVGQIDWPELSSAVAAAGAGSAARSGRAAK